MSNATVREATTSSPTAIPSDAAIIDAARLLTSQDVGSLPVVDGGELVGTVTDRDPVLRVLAKDLDPHKASVADACTHDPEARPAESLDAALQRMAENQVRRLPVVDDGRLVGILAQADVARSSGAPETGRMVEEISEESPAVVRSSAAARRRSAAGRAIPGRRAARARPRPRDGRARS